MRSPSNANNALAAGQRILRLEKFLARESHEDVAADLDIAGRLARARENLERVKSPAYLGSLRGSIGADLLGAYPD